MTEHGREAQRDPDEFGSDPQIAWSPTDRPLDTQARELMRAVIERNDSEAFAQLMACAGSRLHEIEQVVLDEVGLCGDLELVAEWFTALLVGRVTEVPVSPLAECATWMTARAHALVSTLAAQSLPWEDGYQVTAPAAWMDRLAVETDDAVQMYVVAVTLHRLPRATRRVMRQVQVKERDLASACSTLRLSAGQGQKLFTEGRMALVLAMEAHLRGGPDA